MATLVLFHAHPDDEAIATGGTMAKAAADGHRVVLVTATKGELGEYPDGFLKDDETLAAVRTEELHEAAEKLAAILREESADVLVVYDENGVYGHPDHIQVHRVGVRAAELAGVKRVFQATVNRTAWRKRMEELAIAEGAEPQATPTIDFPIGVEEEALTHAIDVADFIDVKRKAMKAHASQITEDSWFMKMSDEDFAMGFGTEWYIALGATGGTREPDLFADL